MKNKSKAKKEIKEDSERGRPTKYKPEYCEMLMEHMESGLAYESFAGTIRVNRDTLYQWEKDFPEFSDAKKVAKELCFLWWDKLGRDGVRDKEHFDDEGKLLYKEKVNTGVYVFNMKNRHSWKDNNQEGSIDNKLNISLNYNLKEGALNGSDDK